MQTSLSANRAKKMAETERLSFSRTSLSSSGAYPISEIRGGLPIDGGLLEGGSIHKIK